MATDFRKNYKGFYQKSHHIGILVSVNNQKSHGDYNPQLICNYCGQKATKLFQKSVVCCRDESCRTVAAMTSREDWMPYVRVPRPTWNHSDHMHISL